jgi:para-nitrobenzyl esterase
VDTQMIRTGTGWRAVARLCAGAIALGTLVATASAAQASATTASAVTATAAHGSASAAPVISTADGAVRGTTAGTVQEFLGIPYAAPPVGPLRWRPPQAAAPWSGVRDATTFGPNCAQPGGLPFGIASSSENCLYLNVYAPAGAQHRTGTRPVLVWIHGGGLWLGEGQDYDPAQLVAAGTVVVTINYRLGALGFLAHPALADRPGGSAGNYGLMDQQAALRWVQRNIGQFGGNPRNVTIAGESAGGLSVLAQLASPGARGLFDRAIVESGAFALTQTPLATAEAAGQAFAAKAGCASQTAACLRALPVSAILDSQGSSGYTPGVVDGTVLTQSIATALASGHFNRVPIIDGSNRDEQRLFVALGLSINFGRTTTLQDAPVTAANYQATIASALGVSPAAAADIAAQYPVSAYSSPPVAFSALDTDANFSCPALQVDQWTSRYVPTFGYEFNDENAPERFLPPTSFPYGAAHESELQYLFGLPNPPTPFPGALTAQQQKLATSMQRYWAGFAARGIPSVAGQPGWPAFGPGQVMLSLNTPQPRAETDFAAIHHCGFWAHAGEPVPSDS